MSVRSFKSQVRVNPTKSSFINRESGNFNFLFGDWRGFQTQKENNETEKEAELEPDHSNKFFF